MGAASRPDRPLTTPMTLFETAPNGFFAGDLILLWQVGEPAVAVRGFSLELGDWRHATPTVLNELQDQMRLLLRSLGEHQRLDWQWFCDSDCRAEVSRYAEATPQSDNEWVRLARDERHQRYLHKVEARQLRRQRLVVFIVQPTAVRPTLFTSRARLLALYDSAFHQVQEEFEHFGATLTRLFASHGIRVTPMSEADHYQHYFHFLNPSFAQRGGDDPMRTFDPERSVQENCWLSEATGVSDVGFWMDGFYHGMLAVVRWPQISYPGIIHKLTHLKLLNYRLSLGIEPLAVQAEIAKEEGAHRRLMGDLASEKKVGLETVLEKKRTKIRGLMEGFLRPYLARFIIRTWAPSREELAAQITTLKQAVNAMNGAQYFEASLPATMKKLFFQSWPGRGASCGGHRKLYAEDSYLADLVPLSSSFTGSLAHAEALYDGPQGGLIGLSTFSV